MKRTLLCVLIVLTLIASLGIYQYSKLNNVSKPDENDVTSSSVLAMVLVEGSGDNITETELDSFPDPNTHYLDFQKSYCLNGAKIGFDKANNKVKITSNKADSCKLYFRAGTAVNMKADVLAKNTLVTTTPSFSQIATDTNTNIYQAEDDLGISYYFRGAATNNYVQFGVWQTDVKYGNYVYCLNTNVESTCNVYFDTKEACVEYYGQESNCIEADPFVTAGELMYWRIVRINGDGTIRLVYDGTAKSANGIEQTAVVAQSQYSGEGQEKYAGYTYEENNVEVDGFLKQAVDKWYQENMIEVYNKYIADSLFCNDTGLSGTLQGSWDAYNGQYRLETTKMPTLKCADKNDRYTVNDTVNGNGLLTYPAALLNVDEAAMAGAVSDYPPVNNTNYYLYRGGQYWTMTPGIKNASNQFQNYDYSSWLHQGYSTAESGVRPVINLDADLLFTGNGTIDSPYVVAGYEQ